MCDAPSVSVVMVFHRDSPYLRPAIRSVLEQSWRDFELVLVDNGTGLSAADLGPAGIDPRLRWVRMTQNEGIPGGHNAGIGAARGRYVALFDYDDLMPPQRLERQVAVLERDAQVALVSGRAERIDETDRTVGEEFTLTDWAEQYSYLQYGAPFPMPACLGRSELFRAYPYRATFPVSADLDFLTRAAERHRFAATSSVELRYRWYPQQTTQDKRSAIEQSRAAIRLLTARRRAGRDENAARIQAWMTTTPPVLESCRYVAERALEEGFSTLAAYQARRMIAEERRPRVIVAAWRLAREAIARATPEQRLVTRRMFWRGPVKALRLVSMR